MARPEYSWRGVTVSALRSLAGFPDLREAVVVGLNFVRPLEDDWREVLDAVARRRGWPTSHDVQRLADCVSALSRAYNDPTRARSPLSESGPARLGFSFVRDVPKGAAAIRELVATGALARCLVDEHRPDARLAGPDDRVRQSGKTTASGTLRILDLGAGLGAMTWGVVRALRAAGATLEVDATWLDDDPAALKVGMDILHERGDTLRVHCLARPLDDVRGLGQFDLVLAGNVLSEVGVSLSDEARTLRHVEIVRRLLDGHVQNRGAVVVIEPALRDRTRRLHQVRDGLVKLGFSVFAPCLHSSSCPALARESDWCHEDLPVDLPEWVAPIARAAGLRYQGLTFSYLVLTRDRARLADLMPTEPGRNLRVVSDCRSTKGKSEAFLCGEFRSAAGSPTVARTRVTRLDRDRAPSNEAWGDLGRGDLLEVEPPLEIERPRIVRATGVRRVEAPGAARVESH